MAGTVAVLVLLLVLGFACQRRGGRPAVVAAWLATAAGFVAVHHLLVGAPAPVRMLGLTGALLLGTKGIVAVVSRRHGRPPLNAARWPAFAIAWFGMRPEVFQRRRPRTGGPALIARGAVRIGAGLALVLAAHAAFHVGAGTLATAILLLPGLSLLLHFGLFTVLVGLWRRAGFPCRPLFHDPLRTPDPPPSGAGAGTSASSR